MSYPRTFVLVHDRARQGAIEAIKTAPDGYKVKLSEPSRTLDQNAKFHAICGNIADSNVLWAGKKRTADQWKVLLVSAHAVATNEESEVLRGLEGEFICIRESTARMSKKRGASLIEYSLAFCATMGVNLVDFNNRRE